MTPSALPTNFTTRPLQGPVASKPYLLRGRAGLFFATARLARGGSTVAPGARLPRVPALNWPRPRGGALLHRYGLAVLLTSASVSIAPVASSHLSSSSEAHLRQG